MRVFLSYAHSDREQLKDLRTKLSERLEPAAPSPVFLDTADLEPDEDFRGRIQDYIQSCGSLAVLWTPRAATSDWVSYELALAQALDKRILLLSGPGAPDLPAALGEYERIEIVEAVSPPPRAARELQVSSLGEFIAAIENDCGRSWIFRGAPDAGLALEPSIDRLSRFRVSEEREAAERELLNRFKREATPFLGNDGTPLDDWGWLVLAHTHGLPTRLLEWSSSSAVALFLAVAEERATTDSAVWCCRPPVEVVSHQADPFSIQEVTLLYPTATSHEISLSLRQACFTVHPCSTSVDRHEFGDRVTIVISNEARGYIRRELEIAGFTVGFEKHAEETNESLRQIVDSLRVAG